MKEFKTGWYTPLYNYRVLVVQEPNFFLAIDDNTENPSVIAVSILDEEGPVYSNQPIKGPYVMIDTYTYETQARTQRTVPLVVSLKHYEMMKNTEKKLEEGT